LLSEKVGGEAISVSDDFFASKNNLVLGKDPIFIPDKFTLNGKWMDGWESRRKRTPGNDWCILKLGLPGKIHGINVDTRHFTGNYPEACTLSACEVLDGTDPKHDSTNWVEILPKSPLAGDKTNLFSVIDQGRYTHIKLDIFPDGGVARLRIHGEVLPNWNDLAGKEIDLAALANGGVVVTCNDNFFGPKDNLIMPGRAANMGEGWETKRRRRPGNDWIIVRFGKPGRITNIEIDTNHFKGNFPDSCSIEGCYLKGQHYSAEAIAKQNVDWQVILPQTKLAPHKQHYFSFDDGINATVKDTAFDHLRMNIFPDGGVSRLRVVGRTV